MEKLSLKYLIYNLVLLLIPAGTFAQLNENIIPLSATEKLKKALVFVELNTKKIDRVSFTERIKKRELSGLKDFYFAERLDVLLSPENSGQWEETEAGKIWRLGIRSSYAYSIYLTFQKFRLNPGVKLFVYSPDYSQLRGAFSEKNNSPSQILSTTPVAGDKVIIELNVPPGLNNYGSLALTKVYHDVTDAFGKADQTSSGIVSCTFDENINCENGTYWQTDKRAVCKIITDGALSTGTLIANTVKDKQPYLLTSYHTIFDDEHAAESVFIFNYEYSGCSPQLLNEQQTLSGASLVASAEGLDFALLRLNETPPASYHPYYAGWDMREISPGEGVCIHHPEGKPKQIAIDYHSLTSATFNDGYRPNSSWKVNNWDIGTTEPGSSGAPLFNGKHRMVGTLTGGYATCSRKGSDYFNKISMSWKGDNSKNQLKTWLDAAETGLNFMDGYDPYGFNAENCDVAWNIFNYESVKLDSSGQVWGYLSGHNSSGFTRYAEKFISPASLLLPGFYMKVAKASYSHPLSYIILKIWEGDDTPTTEIYSKSVFLKDMQPGKVNYIELDSIVKLTGNFFIGYEINYNFPADTFALYQSVSRGKKSASSMYVFDSSWHNINTISSVNYSGSLAIGINECYGRTYRPGSSALQIYPNPGSNYIYFKLPVRTAIDEVKCLNTAGQQVPVLFEPSEVNDRLLFDLPPGLYILKVKAGGEIFAGKFLVEN